VISGFRETPSLRPSFAVKKTVIFLFGQPAAAAVLKTEVRRGQLQQRQGLFQIQSAFLLLPA
jgi:hypothetical protein